MAAKNKRDHNSSKPVAMPVKLATVKLRDPWTNWTFTARINFPVGMYATMIDMTGIADTEGLGKGASPEEQRRAVEQVAASLEKLRDALGGVIIDWNFVDIHGKPLPNAQDGGLELLDGELLGVMMGDLLKEAATVPQKPSDK